VCSLSANVQRHGRREESITADGRRAAAATYHSNNVSPPRHRSSSQSQRSSNRSDSDRRIDNADGSDVSAHAPVSRDDGTAVTLGPSRVGVHDSVHDHHPRAGHRDAVRGDQDAPVPELSAGDGGINRGPFMEALNWAKVYELPVLFVCENNQIAATTTTKTVTAGAGIAVRAESFGIPAVTIDGNDLLLVDRTAARLVDEIRGGGGPRLMPALTYRLRGHFANDKALYREPGEAEAALEGEPIRRAEAWLLEQGITETEIAGAKEQAETRIAQYVADAHAAPWPDLAAAFTDVQDVGAPVMEAGQ